MSEYVNVRLSRYTWKIVNAEREPNETIDEAFRRILTDRTKYRKMILEQSGSVLDA